jgi:hypothetical protein
MDSVWPEFASNGDVWWVSNGGNVSVRLYTHQNYAPGGYEQCYPPGWTGAVSWTALGSLQFVESC